MTGATDAPALGLPAHVPVGTAIARVAEAQLRYARGLLDEPDEDAVHEARKALKRLRALLRLSRGRLPKAVRKAEDRRFRDAGRALAGARDAVVLVEALDDVAAPGSDDGRAVEGLRARLVEARTAAQHALLADPVTVPAVAASLEAALAVDWALEEDAAAYRTGLRRTAAAAHRALDRAHGDPSPERLHAWRKRVKDLWHHAEVLAPAWPALLEPWAAQAHVLSGHLGDHHDLAVLAEAAAAVGAGVLPDPARRRLSDLVVHRQEELAAAAFGLGARLHAESPEAYADRMTAYLLAWAPRA